MAAFLYIGLYRSRCKVDLYSTKNEYYCCSLISIDFLFNFGSLCHGPSLLFMVFKVSSQVNIMLLWYSIPSPAVPL